jgi:hypothetical protein
MAPPKEITPEQKRNMKFSEDRFQLLEDIHEMIGKELDSRGIPRRGVQEREKPMPVETPTPVKQSFFRRLWQHMTKMMGDRWWAGDDKGSPA